MHIVGPACIAQIFPCLLLFSFYPQLSWGKMSLARGVCWNTFLKALSSSQTLCVSSAKFLQSAFAAVSPKHLSLTAFEAGWWIAILPSCRSMFSSIMTVLTFLSILSYTAGRLIHFQRPHSTVQLFAGRPIERLCNIFDPKCDLRGRVPLKCSYFQVKRLLERVE